MMVLLLWVAVATVVINTVRNMSSPIRMDVFVLEDLTTVIQVLW